MLNADIESQRNSSLTQNNDKTEKEIHFNKEIDISDDNLDNSSAYDLEATYTMKCQLINSALNEMGFGLYQLQLLLVAGLGWLADNLWIQAIALSLTWVQYEFEVEHPGMATLGLYVGLVVGATFFGYSADIFGRRLSFNVTLFLTGAFGTAIGSANNFVAFASMAAGIGLGLGGNLPVDGALFLEFLPAKQQYLLTFLSSFWAVGQLISSVVIWGFVSRSEWACTEEQSAAHECNWDTNAGWRYGLFVCGGFTLLMFITRVFILPIKESPKYLLSQGDDVGAVEVIQHIAKKNKVECPLSIEKLHEVTKNYESHDLPRKKFSNKDILLRNIKQLNLSHIKPLFGTKKLTINTILLMTSWALVGLAYPLFNSFLPVYLSEKSSDTYHTYRDYTIQAVLGVPGSLIAAGLVEIRGRWFGRRGAMAIFTLLTGIFIFLFTTSQKAEATLGFNCIVAFAENASYGILFAYTPEAFPGPHRATGDALCSSLNRFFGLFAPIIKEFANTSSDKSTIPLYVSGALFLFSGLSQFFLPIETAGRSAM